MYAPGSMRRENNDLKRVDSVDATQGALTKLFGWRKTKSETGENTNNAENKL